MIVMKVGHAWDQAILAVLSSTVSGKTFDRLFKGASVDAIDGDVLYVSARNEDCAAEIEDRFALHIANIATHVLGTKVGLVMAVPKQAARAN
jgi:chromosomal replication initiation ATPase DnaA